MASNNGCGCEKVTIAMKLAVFIRKHDPFSLRIYRESVLKELATQGIKVLPFTSKDSIPLKCDLVWDPGLGMRVIPRILRKSKVPVVATEHGMRVFSLPLSELASDWKRMCSEYIAKLLLTYEWNWFGKMVSSVITVSDFAAEELIISVGLPREKIYSIYHGVDHDIFKQYGEKLMFGRTYLLQVADYQPKKNVDYLFSAYAKLPEENRPALLAVLPGYYGDADRVKGIRIIRDKLSSIELAKYYRDALGLVFPSLHETFGMPIVEAMACGCPVITSNITACPEVAGDAALLVNPRSVKDITAAIEKLITDDSLRKSMRNRGLKRARQFTWRKSAEAHLKVFESALEKCKP